MTDTRLPIVPKKLTLAVTLDPKILPLALPIDRDCLSTDTRPRKTDPRRDTRPQNCVCVSPIPPGETHSASALALRARRTACPPDHTDSHLNHGTLLIITPSCCRSAKRSNVGSTMIMIARLQVWSL
jgi:hypothetical protein